MALTSKQKAFIDEYFKDFNATQAALRAGYSPKTAYSIGHENLSKPEIATEIDRMIQEQVMSRDEALTRLSRMARFDISDYVDYAGRGAWVDLEKLIKDGYGDLIRGIKQTPKGGTVIEWSNPDDALKTVINETKPTGTADDPSHVTIRIINDR